MKKTLIIVLAFVLCFSFTACNKKESKENPSGMPNPIVEYDSLEKINNIIGVNLIRPGVMGVDNERFSIIGDSIAQYDCEINGKEWTFRAAYNTTEDISGINDDNNQFNPNEDFVLYTNDFYLQRFFDGERQYTIVVTDPGDMGEDVFSDCCMEMMSIQKLHLDDPVVGDYGVIEDASKFAYVERFGDSYNISVNYNISDKEIKCWTMYNAVKDGDKLTYKGEDIAIDTFDDEGNAISADATAVDNIGYFEFKDDQLYWSGAAEEECKSWVFNKIVYDE